METSTRNLTNFMANQNALSRWAKAVPLSVENREEQHLFIASFCALGIDFNIIVVQDIEDKSNSSRVFKFGWANIYLETHF